MLADMEHAWIHSPNSFDENPVEVLKRNIYVHPFHEEDPKGLIDILGADRVVFGSDYPHPEGMSDPITFVDDLEGLPDEVIRKVMGGNLTRLMGLEAAA
jgi:predicted TIM-barrel fold metal-dependent hydrolase